MEHKYLIDDETLFSHCSWQLYTNFIGFYYYQCDEKAFYFPPTNTPEAHQYTACTPQGTQLHQHSQH